MANGIIDTLKNYYNVATGSGLHEQAMREYLDPFTGGQTYQISEGPVAEYMSNYLKDYTKPDNKVAQAFSEGRRGPGQMRVVGLGESPNPFSVSGIAKAAEMAENPSFQAENLFGEGTLTKVPGGYDYTGGKFDFAADNPVTNFLQDKVFKPSEYVMKFDENFKPLEKFDRDFRNFDQARMGKDILRDILEDDDLDAYSESELMPSDTTKKEGILKTFFKALGSGAADYIRDGGLIGRSIRGIGSLFGDAYKKSRFYNPITASGNRLFAPGARAGDRANLGLRRDARRFANMINRLAAGKRIGRSNLEKIMAKRGLTGIDVEGMDQSIRDSRDTGYGGYGSAEAAAAAAAASGGRDYSSSPGAMAGDMEYGEE